MSIVIGVVLALVIGLGATFAGAMPTDNDTRHPEFRGVQFAPRGLFINVRNTFYENSGEHLPDAHQKEVS
jgi:hypothetical protein